MLQQTTVGTVKNHYDRFLVKFPDLKSLALASEEELLVAWKGLGYYRRARSLKKISEALFKDYKGEFPHDVEALQQITGIGPYTSHALVAIGMDKRGLAIDANLERVISRLYGIEVEKGPKLQKKIAELFAKEEIFSKEKFSYRALNEALMDLGRTYCQARKATCELCPMNKDCVAFSEQRPLHYPVGKTEVAEKIDHELNLLRVFVIKDGRILVYKKESHEWLSGQYEVPSFNIGCTDKKFKQYPALDYNLKKHKLDFYKTGITKYTILNHILITDEKALKKMGLERELVWKDAHEDESNFSTAVQKGVKRLLKDGLL
jgi:A/G-specific adenine glycosylase